MIEKTEINLHNRLIPMSQHNNYLQIISIVFGVVIIGFFVYLTPASLYTFSYEFISDSAPTTTITISAGEYARLQKLAMDYERVSEMVQQAGTSSFLLNKPTTIGTSTVAQVVGRPPHSPYDTLLVNVGDVHGVSVGDNVWWPPGVYLGKVLKVNNKTSLIELISSPGIEHPAIIGDIPAIVTGTGGDGFYAEVPDDTIVSVGDAVISDRFGVPIGVVSVIEQLPTTNLKAVYISRFVSLQSLENIYVER